MITMLQAKHQQILKLWFQENTWSEVGMLVLAHCGNQSQSRQGLRAVHEVTNPIQSTKQVHDSSFI